MQLKQLKPMYKSKKETQEIINKLVDDKEYYGKFGKQFLSNSDIYSLLNSPKEFRATKPDNKAFAEGRYFHVSLLEPEKKDDIVILDCSSRNTKSYKEQIAELGIECALLNHEANHMEAAVETMRSNMDFFNLMYAEGNKFEVPSIGIIKGEYFKGKADIEGLDCLIDLKTTSNINDFKWSAKKYNYDSQAYIYQQLFGKPLIFLVIDKLSFNLGVFRPTESFIRGGEEKVEKALDVYRTFYADDATEDIHSYYVDQEL